MISVLGTTYRLHPLFVILMMLSALTGYFVELLTLFGIVLVHEIGHITAARGFGWRIRRVQLLPFGGVAEVDESGNVPAREELWVALAGPLQNAWMAGLAWLMVQLQAGDPVWWNYFMKANIMIALFNLMPILPLDGGKAMLAVLSYAMRYRKALEATAWSSLVFSAAVVAVSVIPAGRDSGIRLNLLAVGLFLLYSNWYGYRHVPFVFLRFLMGRKEGRSSAGRGALAQPIVVGAHHKVAEITRLFMRERYHLIYVCDDRGSVRLVIPEQRLLHCYFTENHSGRAVSELFM